MLFNRYVCFHLKNILLLLQPVQNKVPTSAQRRRPSSSAKVKQDATITADANDLTKEEQAQHRITSSKSRRLAQVNGLQEKGERERNMQTSANNEEQNKPMNSSIKEIKENGIEEENTRQQSVEKSDQLMSELVGSQAETTEMT